MVNYSVDFDDLQRKLKKNKAYRLADVKDRLKKVAFDVVRFVDSDKIDDLWQIHRDGDDEYIVAMYEDEEPLTVNSSAKSPWSAVPDNAGNSVNVFFDGVPITRVALAPLGIPASDAYLVSNSLPNKLASDESFLAKFVNNLTASERAVLEEALPKRGK